MRLSNTTNRKSSLLQIGAIIALFLFGFSFNSIALPGSGGGGGNGGAPCSSAQPFCSGQGLSFPNNTSGGQAPSGINYNNGCFSSQPNPSWYYLKIGQAGTLQMTLSQSNGDVDFSMWGPFTTIQQACTQINNGSAAPIQFSYSASATEPVGIGVQGGGVLSCDGTSTPPAAQVGEIYMIMMTNYDGGSGTITLNQTGGTGSTDCSIVNCDIQGVSVNVGTCQMGSNTFDITGAVQFNTTYTTGKLIITDCNGHADTISAPFTSPANYSFTGITPDGTQNCKVTAYFTEDPSCTSESSPFDYPAPCVCSPPDITINNLGICPGETLDLNDAINPSSDNATVSFYSSNTDALNGTNPIGNNITAPGTYYLKAEMPGAPICDTVYPITVNANPVPDPAFTFNGFCVGLNKGPDSIATPGGTFSFNPAPVAPDTAKINPSSGVITNGIGGGTYHVKYTVSQTCTADTTIDVSVYPKPVPQFTGDSLISCSYTHAIFTNQTGLTNGTYKWIFGDGSTSTAEDTIHYYANVGTYTVGLVATTDKGCTDSITKIDYVKITPMPTAKFTATPTVSDIIHPTIKFKNKSTNAMSYQWTFGDTSGVAKTFDAEHTYSNTHPGIYQVTLIASNSPKCKDTFQVAVQIKDRLIFYIPDAFTPDGDKYNPVFKPIFTTGFDPQNYTLEIYNRWGQLIFVSHNPEIGWDGTYGKDSNKILKQGIYVWKITVKAAHKDKHYKFKGHVNLLK